MKRYTKTYTKSKDKSKFPIEKFDKTIRNKYNYVFIMNYVTTMDKQKVIKILTNLKPHRELAE